MTNFSAEHNVVYERAGDTLYRDVAREVGLERESLPWVGWGTVFADFDLDTWLDLVVTNGHVDDNRHLLNENAPYFQPPQIWKKLRGRHSRPRAATPISFSTTPSRWPLLPCRCWWWF